MDKKFAFLLVALGSVAFQTVGNIAEVSFPRTIVGKGTGKFVFLVTAEIKLGFVVARFAASTKRL